MANEVIVQPTDVLIGAYGAVIGACTTLGGCEEVEVVSSAATAFSTDHNGRRMDGNETDPTFQLVLRGLNAIQKATITYVMGAELATAEVEAAGSVGAMTEYTVFVTGMYFDAAMHTFQAFKCVIPTSGAWKQGKDQTKFDLTLEMLWCTSEALYWETTPATADTTPPTLSSVSPADAATGVAKAVTTVVDWTFSEAIRPEDVTDENFFVFDAAGAVKAGTLSVYDTANTIVRFTPTAAWAASTLYNAVAGTGVRDTAGNHLAAQSCTQFTTGV